MKQSHNSLLAQAIALIQSGQRQPAARLLAGLLRDAPDSAPAWFWMAAALDAPDQKRACLRRVLQLDPEHRPGRVALARLDREAEQSPTPPSSAVPPSSAAQPSSAAPTSSTALSNPLPHVPPFVALPFLSGTADSAQQPPPTPPNPLVEALLAQGRAAEAGQEYAAALDFYQRALAIDPTNPAAWIGSGAAAAMRSNARTNGFPTWFACLARASMGGEDHRSGEDRHSGEDRRGGEGGDDRRGSEDRRGQSGAVPDGRALARDLAALEPTLARATAARMLRLARFAGTLAATLPDPSSTRFAFERLRLADLAYALTGALRAAGQLDGSDALEITRDQLIETAEDALERGMRGVTATYATPNARRAPLSALRARLLACMESSGLAADSGFVGIIDEQLAEAVIR